MEDPAETIPTPVSLRGIRVAAAVGAVVGCAAVVAGFSFGIVYGLIALFAFPAVPMVFVLAFEGVRGTPTDG